MIDVESNMDIMRPSKGDAMINLPVTFDYSGGRNGTIKGKILGACALGIVGLIFSLGVAFAEGAYRLISIPIGLLLLYVVILIIRFGVFKEHKLRNAKAELEDNDYRGDEKDFWGIYSIDDSYPYYCHFRNGTTGLFVQMDKDVILGKKDEAEFEHYEAIGEAYKLVGSKKWGNLYHIDYMDNIGNDERMVESFKSLPNIENPDLRDIMTDIYSYLQEKMSDRVSTFDVYCFNFLGNEANFWYDLQEVIGELLNANYISFKILNSDDIRELTKSVMNLHHFSVVEANMSISKGKSYKGVVPIKLVRSDGSEEKLGKTVEEIKEEKEIKMRESQLKKEEVKKRKKMKKEEKKIKKNLKANEIEESENLFDILDGKDK